MQTISVREHSSPEDAPLARINALKFVSKESGQTLRNVNQMREKDGDSLGRRQDGFGTRSSLIGNGIPDLILRRFRMVEAEVARLKEKVEEKDEQEDDEGKLLIIK